MESVMINALYEEAEIYTRKTRCSVGGHPARINQDPAGRTHVHKPPSTHCGMQGLSMDRRRFLQMAAVLASMPLAGHPLAREIAQPAATPGGLTMLNLGAGASTPVVHYNDERVLVVGNPSGWLAIVGIALDSKPGRAPPVTIRHAGEKPRFIHFTIREKRYESEYLTIKSDLVELTPDDLARYKAERTHTRSVLRSYSDLAPASLRLNPPCDGARSSTFGLLRFFNGQPRSAHSGMDFSAPVGATVIAAGPGEVIDIGDYFFSGRTVMVSHGRGFITLYSHLSAIDVRLRKRIKAGQPMGKVGVSGRVTGPHLHFGVYLNAVAVDPALFLPRQTRHPDSVFV